MTQKIRSSSPLRRTLLAALLAPVLATAVLVSTPTTEAAPAGNCIYYSDSTYRTEVGRFGRDCCNNVIARGTRTSYSKCSPGCFFCVPPPPR